MKVLITGSSGHIGSAVASRFSLDAEIIGIDLVPGRFTTHIGKIQDAGFIRSLINGVDVVIHTAGLHAPHVGKRKSNEFRETNVDGTRCLLDAAEKHQIRCFVMTSTTSVYGCTNRKKDRAVWVTEELEPNPEDIYDETKLEAENLCRQAADSGLTAVVLRMSRCFPEPDHLLAFYRLYRGIDRRDVAEGHFLAATWGSKGFEIFNLSSDSPFKQEDCKKLWDDPWAMIDDRLPSVRDLFERMAWQRPARIDRVYVIEKAKQILGFNPQHNFQNFINEFFPK